MSDNSHISEDVRAVYRAFGHNELSYQEVTEQLRYEQVVKKWPLLYLVHHPIRGVSASGSESGD